MKLSSFALAVSLSCIGLAPAVGSQILKHSPKGIWIHEIDAPGSTTTFVASQATYRLGTGSVSVLFGFPPVIASFPAADRFYAETPFDINGTALVGGTFTFLSTATMLAGSQTANGAFPSVLTVETLADSLFPRSASTSCLGSDQQVIDTPGVSRGVITLGVGSSVFSDASGFAAITFSLSAPLLESPTPPLASISAINFFGFFPIFEVTLATADGLSFFDPGTAEPISADDVRARLLNAEGFRTPAGLTNDLPLFGYVYDMTKLTIPAGSSFRIRASASGSSN